MFKMHLADGTEVEFAGVNGNNFIVPDQKEMDVSIFTDDNLKSGQIITDDGQEIPFENLSFVQQQLQQNGDYYICFYEKSAREILDDEVHAMLVQLAETEVSAGNLELEDIVADDIKEEVRAKIDDDKWIDK